MAAGRRGRGTAVGLTRADVAAAARVAEVHGFAGTSLRRVADELDVTTPALYNHVESKEALVDAVADAFVGRLLKRQLPREPLSRVRELARRLHRAGLDHPGLLSNVIGHIPDDLPSAQMTFAEQLLGSLLETGATEEQAHLLYATIVALVLGSTVTAANLHSPAKHPLEQRLSACAADPELPLTGRMVSSSVYRDRAGGFDRQLDFILRDLAS
jgi:AcrR family transcriptional regulator